MAEGDGALYNVFKYRLLGGEFNLANAGDVIKTMMGHTYTPDIDAHVDKADVDAAWTELSGTGYTAGGETLAGQAISQDDANDRGKFDGTDETWTGLDAGTPSHAVMWDDTTTNDLPMAYWEVVTASNGGDYTLQWHADGIILLT